MLARRNPAATAAMGALGRVATGIAGYAAGRAARKITDNLVDGAVGLASNLVKSVGSSKSARRRQRKRGRVPTLGSNLAPGLGTMKAGGMGVALAMPNIQSRFSMSSNVSRNAEIGSNQGIRVTGSDLFSDVVACSGTDAIHPFYSGASYYTSINVKPSIISNRLLQFEDMFQFYAIRELQLHYLPSVGTETGGSFAFALENEVNATLSPVTQQTIMQYPSCCITQIWQPATARYVHTGSKVWSPYTGASTPAFDIFQLEMIGCFNATLSAATYGNLFVEYVIDFYLAAPIDSAETIVRHYKRLGLSSQEKVLHRLMDYMSLRAGVEDSSKSKVTQVASSPPVPELTEKKDSKDEEKPNATLISTLTRWGWNGSRKNEVPLTLPFQDAGSELNGTFFGGSNNPGFGFPGYFLSGVNGTGFQALNTFDKLTDEEKFVIVENRRKLLDSASSSSSSHSPIGRPGASTPN